MLRMEIVPFRSLRDHYFFDDRSYRAIGAHGGKILSIGMPVTIVVEKVDTEENKIDFSFEYGFEEERNPGDRRVSKPGKKGRDSDRKGRSRKKGRETLVKRESSGRKGGRKSIPSASRGASKAGSSGKTSESGSFKGFTGKPRNGRTGRAGGRGRK